MASVAELKRSFFAGIDKVENREDLEKLRVKYLGREKGILTAVLRSPGGMPSVVYSTCSSLDSEMVSDGRNDERAAGRRIGLERLTDRITDELLHGLLHGARAKRLVNAPSHQKFKRDVRDGKVEALLPETVKLLGNDKPANFPLRVRGKRLEDDFFIEASDEFRSKKFVKFGENRPFQRSEGQPGRP